MTSAISARSWVCSIGCTRTGTSYNAGRRITATRIAASNYYLDLVLPGVLGLLLGLLGLVVLLPEPLLGEVVLLELGVLGLLLPVAPPLLPPLVEESVLKCASHSEREI